MSFRSPKLLRSAEGQPCVLCGSIGTTVSAHCNMPEYGKGVGIKCSDALTAQVCQYHHDLIDGRTGKLNKEEKREMWTRAFILTVKRLFDQGVVMVK